MVQIGIFPASGGIGGGTVKHISTRMPAKELTLIARSPEKLEDQRKAGATVRYADYDDDASLEHAFVGVDMLFLISYASVEHHHRTARQRLAIDLALKSGVKYIFYASLGFAGSPDNQETVAHVMRAHVDTEQYLTKLSREVPGFAFTVVRQGLYSESYPLYTAFFDPRSPSEEIKIPHDGSGPGIAWVKREELGEGNAEFVKRFLDNPTEFQYRNSTVLLSGQKTLTLAGTVDILGEIANAPVKIKNVSVEDYAKQPQNSQALTYRGYDYSPLWASAFEAFRRGEGSYVSPLLRELLGREQESFKTTISNHQSTTRGRFGA
ncbi:hypothetical protein Q7P37_007766 [Cladosporium fusiforme]